MNNHTLKERQFLSITELAGYWGVSYHTVYRSVHSGEIPYIKIRGSFRIPVEYVISNEAQHLVSPGYEPNIIKGEE